MANGSFTNGSFSSFAGVNSYPQSLHKYGYANSDPVNGIDPSGNFTVLELLSVAATAFTVATIGIQVYNGVNKIRALGELDEVNLLLSELDLEPEFLILFSHYTFYLAMQLISQLAELSFSILKEVIGAYSGAVATLCFVKDTFFADDDGSLGNSLGSGAQPEASIAKSVEDYNSDNSVADMVSGRAWEAAQKLFLKGKAVAGKKIKVNGRTTFPDDIDQGLSVLTEFKSTQAIYFSKQLRDYMSWCQDQGLKFVIRHPMLRRDVTAWTRGASPKLRRQGDMPRDCTNPRRIATSCT